MNVEGMDENENENDDEVEKRKTFAANSITRQTAYEFSLKLGQMHRNERENENIALRSTATCTQIYPNIINRQTHREN
jgi:hypothetical protein